MRRTGFAALHPGQAIPREQVPDLTFPDFRAAILSGVARGQRVAALVGDVPSSTGELHLYAVLADSARALLRVGRASVDADSFPSLTPDDPQVHIFEREIAEQYGARPDGHPWLKPVR